MYKKFTSLPKGEKINLLFFPIFLAYRMPVVWFRSLYECRVLLQGRWERYGGCHPIRSYQHFWTKTQWLNISLYGRGGVTPLMGTGEFNLSKLFHVAPLGHYIYANAAAASVLCAGIFWSFSHLIWLNFSKPFEVFIYLAIIFLGSTNFAMVFSRQNYSILGWMWTPLVLYSTLNGELLSGLVFMTLISLLSFTATFFTALVVVFILLITKDVEMLLILFPSFLIWVLSILSAHNFSYQKIKYTLYETFKIIGGTSRDVKYSYNLSKDFKNIGFLYHLFLYGALAIVYFYINKHAPLLLAFGILILFVNTLIMRLADEQTILIMLMMLTFIDVVTVNFNWFVAVIFWICVSPPAFLFNLQPTNKTSNLYIEPEVHSPFDHTNLISIIEEFFLPVCDGKRILFSVKNPEGEYFKIFDGYRYLLEPLMWVVSKRSILLMPNWYSVMENNFLAAPTFWGRDLGSIYKNLNNFDCDYVLYYYDELNPIQAGILEEFKIIGRIDWKNHVAELGGKLAWPNNIQEPVFLLLQK
jgi:hypothetical protein